MTLIEAILLWVILVIDDLYLLLAESFQLFKSQDSDADLFKCQQQLVSMILAKSIV